MIEVLISIISYSILFFGIIISFVFIAHQFRYKEDEVTEIYPFQNAINMILNQHRLCDFIYETFNLHRKKCDKDTMTMKIPGMNRFVFTLSLENIEYILKTKFENFGKGPAFKERFQGLLGDGIFNTDGKVWYNHRKVSSLLFNTRKFKTTILDTYKEHSETLLSIIHKFAKQKAKFDIQDLMFKFTLDSIGQIAFGYNIGALNKERVEFADAFDYCQEMAYISFLNPLHLLYLHLTYDGWKYKNCIRIVDEYAYDLVRRRRIDYEKEKSKSNSTNSEYVSQFTNGDLLSLFLDRETDGENKEPLTDTFLRDVVLNFIIAGRDTTAQV